MSIEGLVIEEAKYHIGEFGFVKNMDPMLLHILKTSERPVIVAMRRWIRWAGVQTFLRAEKSQVRMDDEFAHEPYSRRSGIRRRAVLDPYFTTKAVQQGKSWNDGKFVGRIQRDNPKCFPKREAL